MTLQSASLLGGAITAAGVQATDGKGTVSGLEIDGSPVTLEPGQMVAVSNWAQLTLGDTVGRLSASLVVVLLAPHDSLPAGTTIAVAFAASAQVAVKPKASHQPPTSEPPSTSTTPAAGSHERGRQPAAKKPKQRRKPPPHPSTVAAPLALSPSRYVFPFGGALGEAAQDNRVVSTAIQYLGIRYKWAGASPATGFDCSGLVKFVFAQLGVSLPHYAAAQWSSPMPSGSGQPAPTRRPRALHRLRRHPQGARPRRDLHRRRLPHRRTANGILCPHRQLQRAVVRTQLRRREADRRPFVGASRPASPRRPHRSPGASSSSPGNCSA